MLQTERKFGCGYAAPYYKIRVCSRGDNIFCVNDRIFYSPSPSKEKEGDGESDGDGGGELNVLISVSTWVPGNAPGPNT